MVISVQPLPVGNALKLRVSPPAGAVGWRILRKDADAFLGPDDDTALVAYEGNDLTVVDHQFLRNGVEAFYRPFYLVDGEFVAGETVSATPEASYEDHTQDPFDILRERLEAGLQVEVKRRVIRADAEFVQVMTAPPPIDNNLRFPLVSIHLEDDAPQDRFIGEEFDGIGEDPMTGDFLDGIGWVASTRISVVGWSLNPDERNELRKAIRRVIIANMEVFASHGMDQVAFNQTNNELLGGEQGANLYLSEGTFTCTAPVTVASRRLASEQHLEISIEVDGNVKNPFGECGCSG